ncbi:MAG TPA: PPC domain-containing protein [Pontiellaceae bacterium]|nr:PPC domain-containing protein [Pontiellaceae bacterium]
MKKMTRFIFLLLGASAGSLSAAVAPHVGFVYPAGGTPGTTFTVTIGGQYLRDFKDIHLSNVPVKAQLTDYLRIYDSKEGGGLRRKKETLEAKMAEATDARSKLQLQKQIEMLEPEIAMVAEVRRQDRMNPSMAAKKQFNPQISERITLEITLPAAAKPGEYELRVITTNGLSNPLLFEIGRLPEIAEVEPNDLTKNAAKLPVLPVLVNGQILPGDVDSFRFHALKDQTLVIKASARSLVPYLADAVPGWFQSVLTLYDANGKEVAYDDDYLFNPDPVLIYHVPETGDYTFSIRDSIYRGREDFVYRISIGELPFIERIFPLGGPAGSELDVNLYGVNLPYKKIRLKTNADAPETQYVHVEKGGLISNSQPFGVSPFPDRSESEPNNQFSEAVAVTNDTAINGTIGKPGDHDWFCFKGRKGEQKTIEVFARRLGSPMDSCLTLFDTNQQVLAVNDDAEDKSFGLLTHQADSRIDFTLPETGIYYVRLDDQQNKGGDAYAYRLVIGKEKPDFQLRVVPSSLRIPRNGTAIATVYAIRYGGFTDAISCSVRDAPTEIELQRAVIPAGTNVAKIVITARPRAAEQMMTLDIEGVADCGSRTVRRHAVPAEDMMQAFIYRHLVTAQQMLVQVTEPEPVSVVLTIPKEGFFRAHPGKQLVISASAQWAASAQKSIKLTLAEPPEWLTLRTATWQAGNIILDISPNAEPGDTATVLLTGTVKVNKSPKDADFNPVMKFLNNRTADFTIDAIPIQVVE